MANLKIYRVQTDEDFLKCLEVRRRVFIEEQGCTEEEEIDEHEGEAVHFLAVLDGEPVGTGRFRLKDGLVKFERIATLAHVRRWGIGKAILECMEKEVKIRYPKAEMMMHAQVQARGFYEKMGWRAEGDVFDEAGIEHIVMKK